jgi:hypothetical protein
MLIFKSLNPMYKLLFSMQLIGIYAKKKEFGIGPKKRVVALHTIQFARTKRN